MSLGKPTRPVKGKALRAAGVDQKWMKRFLDVATLIASWSKDRSTKVGAVIAGKNREILSTGYNGFPRGVDDTKDERHERPVKYEWTEHAERNAIFNAARHGIHLEGSMMFTTYFPCTDCARAIIQAGIVQLVTGIPNLDDERWGSKFRIALDMFREANVEITYTKSEESEG